MFELISRIEAIRIVRALSWADPTMSTLKEAKDWVETHVRQVYTSPCPDDSPRVYMFELVMAMMPFILGWARHQSTARENLVTGYLLTHPRRALEVIARNLPETDKWLSAKEPSV